MNAILNRIGKADVFLYVNGWLHIAAAFSFLCFAPWDDRTVGGVNTWIKPAKFALAFAVYLWTLALYVKELDGPRWAVLTIRFGASFLAAVAMAGTAIQAGRGVGSHFNVATQFDLALFSTMGLALVMNTLLMLLLLFQIVWQQPDMPAALLFGMRLGVILFILGSFEGLLMILNQSHTVGAPDGGPGLPFLNWSTTHGDLRIAHIVGLTGFQMLPLAGWLADRWFESKSEGVRLAAVGVFAAGWVGIFALMWRIAASGRPLLAV
ncbi:MAG: hypothetical protein R2729_01710 [Bryobacteraceae bacterium]